MNGRAMAPAAGTILNALATGIGSAFAIDAYITASVELRLEPGVSATIDAAPDADTSLVERCVEVVVDRYGDGQGARVHTESEVPMAAGLKSSSAAANATVLATLEALGTTADPIDAARLGVRAARETGVTVTGAFDDASASMLGGVTVTDNTEDRLLAREAVDWDVLVWTPEARAYTADADVDRCRQVAPMARLVEDLALDGNFTDGMTVNGLAFCAALGFSAEPLLEAMSHAAGVSLSGTGPSVTAVGDRDDLEQVRDHWDRREGHTWLTTTQTNGARTA